MIDLEERKAFITERPQQRSQLFVAIVRVTLTLAPAKHDDVTGVNFADVVRLRPMHLHTVAIRPPVDVASDQRRSPARLGWPVRGCCHVQLSGLRRGRAHREALRTLARLRTSKR